MTPLAAVLILEQLPRLEGKVAALNSHYTTLEARLGQCLYFCLKSWNACCCLCWRHPRCCPGGLEGLEFPARRLEEQHVGSSFQFRLPGRSYAQLEAFHRWGWACW